MSTTVRTGGPNRPEPKLAPPRALPAAEVSPGIVGCPGLQVTANAGIFFTDCLKRVHNVESQKWFTIDEAASDPRMRLAIPRAIESADKVIEVMIRRGELYPVWKKNARVILIADCAITDWQARQLATAPIRHLAAQRAEKVA